MHVNAGSCTVQVALQPSPSTVFLSSHTSPGLITPSPQAFLRVHAPADGQFQFGSMWQMPLQPSPATVLPSSQASIPPWLLIPSPQPSGTGSVPPTPVMLPPPVPMLPPTLMVPPVPTEPPLPGPPRPPPPPPPLPIGSVGLTPALQPTPTTRNVARPSVNRTVGREPSCNISAPYRPGL